jgi:sortase A
MATGGATGGGIVHPRARPGRSWRARGARVLSALLIVAGVLVLVDAGVTLVWQEPISALYALLRQDSLRGQLRGVERAAPTAAERRTLASLPEERERIAFLARELRAHASRSRRSARATWW